MRQRLLLVAGWIAAAVGAGLVASGAVAVAGGQVLDRPLRPLTAAEVAALPVVEVGAPDAFEPHASGGFVSTTGGPTAGSEDDAQDDSSPVSAGGSTADTSEPSTNDPVAGSPNAVVEIASSQGGRASFVEVDGTLVMLWATPTAGYVASTRSVSPTAITIAFSSSRAVWLVEAQLNGSTIAVVSRPEPLT